MFESSNSFSFFDYFRVPYLVRPSSAAIGQLGASLPVHRLQAIEQTSRSRSFLMWLASEECRTTSPARHPKIGRYQMRDFTFFGHVAFDAAIPAMLAEVGGQWHCAEPILDHQGQHVASVWRDTAGSLFLPFDPNEIMHRFWSEQYRLVEHSAMATAGQAALRYGYYLVRPAIPRALQLRLRRAFTQVQGRSSFPRWPIEDSLHNLYAWLMAATAKIAGIPMPFIDAWPDGRSCALVLTHDVETEIGYRDMDLLRDLERELGYRSSWNFVALRYRVDDETVQALRNEGCEVGVHGLRHDGRDLGSRRLLNKRLPAMRAYAERWGAVGFRSPSTQRRWDLMSSLGFEYDSSYTDTDPYEPQPGGCCTYLPYFNGNMVELPITLPQDHTMFSILNTPDTDLWLRKARHLREHQGLTLVLVHPDYARDPRVLEAYRKLLREFHGDSSVWHALPGEAATWWRQRNASTLSGEGNKWRINGPAAVNGRVKFAEPDTEPISHARQNGEVAL